MAGTGLAAVMLMVGIVMLVILLWRQILVIMLFVSATVFCFGVYYIFSIISYMR
jgi:hypothetical protein